MCNLSDLIEERGIERGLAQGMERGESRMSRLMAVLADAGRLEDIRRACADRTFRERLYRDLCI